MLTYEDGITYDLIDRLAKRQSKMHQDVLEDIGGYLVAEDSQASIRRLLRFGGATFEDFLLSLDDLNDRVALALDILEMPTIRVVPLSWYLCHGMPVVSLSWYPRGIPVMVSLRYPCHGIPVVSLSWYPCGITVMVSLSWCPCGISVVSL